MSQAAEDRLGVISSLVAPPHHEHQPVERALWQAVDRVADAVVMIDESQRIVVFNRAACQMFRYSVAEVLGHPLEMLVTEAGRAAHRAGVVAFAASGVPQALLGRERPVRARRSSGEEFPVEIAVGRIHHSGRQLFNAVIRDMTRKRQQEQTLRASARYFRSLIQHATDGIVIIDAEGIISFASPLAEEYAGTAEGALVGRDSRDFLDTEDFGAVRPILDEALDRPGTPVRHEARVRPNDRGWVWLDVTVTNLLDDTDVGGLVINFRDVSERKAAEAQREAVAELGRKALRGMPVDELARAASEVVVRLLGADAAAVLEHVDPERDELAVRACVGWSDEALGQLIHAPAGSPSNRTLAQGAPVIIDDYETEPDFPTQEQIRTGGYRSSVGVAIGGVDRPWGVLGVLSASAGRFSPTAADFVQAIANVLGSAIERAHADQQLAHQALHDPLTGLPNRALLVDRIELGLAAVRRSPANPLVVLFVDLDDFKQVNDALGHEVGDELLRQVARRLQAAVREEDSVARFGGDEFVVVTRAGQTLESPLRFADRLVADLRAAYEVRGHRLFVTASIGIALSTAPIDTAETLLRDADAAMYEAKRQGRDRYAIFDRGVRSRLLKRVSTERGLRAALERDELRVHYQPIMDTTRDCVVGFEALVRWAHPTRGLVAPGEFIGVAEDTGLILEMGRRVMRTACQQLGRLQRDLGDPELAMSVNLSPRQLDDPELVATLQDTLASTGTDGTTLRLEITESMLVKELGGATGVLKAIADLGVGVVVDDFGTGYSSLSYLKAFPICCLKIDRSFIAEICDDRGDRAIVAAVTELARRLEIHAVAEGVETPEQLGVLRTLGCTLVQGFHYAPALGADELGRWLARRSSANGRTAPPQP